MSAPSEIIPGLFVGSAANIIECIKGDYDMVINLSGNQSLTFVCYQYVHIPIAHVPDNATKILSILMYSYLLTDILKVLAKLGNVLIFCSEGTQVAPTLAAAYLIRFHGVSVSQAIDLVKRKHKDAFKEEVMFRNSLNWFHAITH
jgi:hypothetical protein